MSNPDIPLLTEIVADPQGDDPAYVHTQQILPRPSDPADPDQTPFESEAFAIFEPDFRGVSSVDVSLGTGEEFHNEPPVHDDDAAPQAQESPGAYRAETLEIEDIETVIAELQTRLASSTFELIDQHMRTAFSDMEARIFREISTNLREQLPELIDSVVREHLQESRSQTDEGD